MRESSWIPADRWPELAPVAAEWTRRAAAVERARERVETLSPAARAADDRARREALAAAYAAGEDPADLSAPLTEVEWEAELADAEEHVAAARRALQACIPEAKAAIREHAERMRADVGERVEAWTAKTEEANRVLDEAQRVADRRRATLRRAERTAEWVERLIADDTFTQPLNAPTSAPWTPPVEFAEVDGEASGGDAMGAALRNATLERHIQEAGPSLAEITNRNVPVPFEEVNR